MYPIVLIIIDDSPSSQVRFEFAEYFFQFRENDIMRCLNVKQLQDI